MVIGEREVEVQCHKKVDLMHGRMSNDLTDHQATGGEK
jgi:hypothetical protein